MLFHILTQVTECHVEDVMGSALPEPHGSWCVGGAHVRQLLKMLGNSW